MARHMWCLFNKRTGRMILVGTDRGGYVVGFATKKSLLLHLDGLEPDEEIRKITF